MKIDEIYKNTTSKRKLFYSINNRSVGESYKSKMNKIQNILKLKKENIYVWSVEQTNKSKKLNTLKIQKNIKHAIILGNEVKGVSQKTINLSNDVIEISQFGTKHSLNVSTCSAILIWEFFNALT